MDSLNGKLDATFHLIDPNVGDGEVTKIEFKHPNVFLEIKLSPTGNVCTIEILRCRYFSCTTEHMQNVIDGVIICSSIDGVSNSLDPKISQLLADELKQRPGKILKIEPITGPDLICLGDDICIGH